MRRRSIDLLLSTSPPSQDGWVELEAVEYRSEQRNNTAPITVVQAATKQADTACNIPTEASPLPDPGDVSQRIRLEAERVRSRYQSLVETESEVTLRFDFMTDRDNRVAMFMVYAATFAGFVILLIQFINIMTKDESTRRFQQRTTFIWNIAVGGVCLIVTTTIFAVQAWRVWQAHRHCKVWKPKRKRHTVLFLTETALQGINTLAYIAPNIYVLCAPDHFLSPAIYWCGWVRWTCWNTLFMLFLIHAYGGVIMRQRKSGTAPKAVVDGPWRWLWPCLLPWALFEVAISLRWLQHVVDGSQRRVADLAMLALERHDIHSSCSPDMLTQICTNVTVGLAIVYFIVTCALILWTLNRHKMVPYREVQDGYVFFRLQLRLRVEVMLFFGLCLVLLWLVRFRSCGSTLFVSFGIMPMQVVMTANAFVWSFIYMPHTPQQDAAAKRIWEQEIAWAEADKPVKLAARALTFPQSDSSLHQQPIFCFITMMKMWYWSGLVYDYKRAASRGVNRRLSKQALLDRADTHEALSSTQRTVLSIRRAMYLYDLTGSELFCELKRDTRCLMGWNDNTIVLAFRGTASMTNALSDLQAWRVGHPPVRGHNFLFTRPLVHKGFLTSWLAGGFNEKVVNRTMEHVSRFKAGKESFEILVTGHSLGGALAILAAYDIRKQLQARTSCDSNVEVICYSIGAPRIGNHAFAREYNQVVPDTWSVINNQDVVTRSGKFFCLYKRPGRRVILDDRGHMMVSPSAIEASLHQQLAGQSMAHHMLSAYHHAMFAVILAQFSSKGFSDGAEGIVRVAEANGKLREVLEDEMDMHLEDMRRYSQLSPEERAGQSLRGAHLPVRGFYQLKSIYKAQKQVAPRPSFLGLPLWWLRPSVGQDSTASSDMQSADIQSNLAIPFNYRRDAMEAQPETWALPPSNSQSEVTDTKPEQLATPFADDSAAIKIKPEEFAAPSEAPSEVVEELARPSDPVTEVVNIQSGESARLSHDLSDVMRHSSSQLARLSSDRAGNVSLPQIREAKRQASWLAFLLGVFWWLD